MYNNYLNNMYRDYEKNNLNRNTEDIFNPTVGYNNGNMFSNLYEQYKNYKPKNLTGKNERENLLLNIGRYSFAAHDIKLYLDLNPKDTSMLALYNDYKTKCMELVNQYESKYGVLNSDANNVGSSVFRWETETWPWEGNINV